MLPVSRGAFPLSCRRRSHIWRPLPGIQAFLDLGTGMPTAGNNSRGGPDVDPSLPLVYASHDPAYSLTRRLLPLPAGRARPAPSRGRTRHPGGHRRRVRHPSDFARTRLSHAGVGHHYRDPELFLEARPRLEPRLARRGCPARITWVRHSRQPTTADRGRGAGGTNWGHPASCATAAIRPAGCTA